ncbi:uncharacterized protein LY89DRAFT_679984 [Mollisia scopiformis]|uniref:Uncharacterized protein n=1 Tax=Mollisia scopiformis TaxID=149040 RepID=A0A194XSA6_MOLSC|nr:uncharacterized protein LY89DRAFT_679984 [Mollisia scopiformis]KUJ23185.1 hypothetical protein LY89DRAFT_679984 [Mollisia scopiformis]
MEPLSISRSESLSTEEMDGLSVLESPEPRSDTPLNDTHNSLSTDTEKGIVVEAPAIGFAESSATMPGQEEEDDEEVVTPFHKRKRASVNYNLDENDYKLVRGSPHIEPPAKRTKQSQKIRGVIIGVWRDSDQPDDADKHVIYGFIDIHDRLRTRIYGMNRRGEELIANAPTGAGGCWVTFERVIFDAHLKGLNSAEIKEYVKIRSEMKPETTAEERHEADTKAVLKAKAYVAEHEGASPGLKPVVHRNSLGRTGLHRHSLPRQALHKTPSFQAVNAADMQTPKASPFSESKPSGVLLGYWADSDEPRLEDKHAVYGVLSGTDCFRVKVQRVTRDGRFVDGNFPVGAGALWLHYDKVVLEPHIAHLNRLEVKEYCRIRQREQENRESDKERKTNELKAAQRAQQVVAEHGTNGIAADQNGSPDFEPRHSSRSEHRLSARNQAEADAAAEKMRKDKAEARERQNEKTRKEVAMAEAVIQEAAQMELKHNLKKLNKVWIAQQQATEPTRASSISGSMVTENEVRYHNGIKYERKQNGPFQGKLVSQAQIFSIDGEDYVEYRVLTKPSFF